MIYLAIRDHWRSRQVQTKHLHDKNTQAAASMMRIFFNSSESRQAGRQAVQIACSITLCHL
jgi:hypothetical protein